jgi:hypothetical protein
MMKIASQTSEEPDVHQKEQKSTEVEAEVDSKTEVQESAVPEQPLSSEDGKVLKHELKLFGDAREDASKKKTCPESMESVLKRRDDSNILQNEPELTEIEPELERRKGVQTSFQSNNLVLKMAKS